MPVNTVCPACGPVLTVQTNPSPRRNASTVSKASVVVSARPGDDSHVRALSSVSAPSWGSSRRSVSAER